MLRVARFLRGFVRHPVRRIEDREVMLDASGGSLPASFVRPRGTAPLPGWIVLHGITAPGRQHPVLQRFTHALASTGAAVLIPEVPAWRKLLLDPEAGHTAIAAAADHLTRRDDIAGANLNLVGFSFGATQALMSAAKPEIAQSVRAVLGFGGYCDLGRTLRCMMTGEHEWAGSSYRFDPDPYGRWIVAGNHITDVPEFAGMEALQHAAYELATESGRVGAYAGDAVYDPYKASLREGLPREQRELWDILAPPHGVRPPTEPGRYLAAKLNEAAIRKQPGLDPRPHLGRIDQKVVLAHGYDDRLIPFTETLRLQHHLSLSLDATTCVTRLFAHSQEAAKPRFIEYPIELARYLALLNRALKPC
ncbi:MAG: hypothetical protein WD737_00965 [Gemmatimonadota bacterium]